MTRTRARTTTVLAPRPALALSALAASGLILAGCSSAGDSGRTEQPATSITADAGQNADFNEADVQFLNGMYPHHAQAIAMTDMVPGHTNDPDVTALSEQIAADQQPEMATMEQLLASWGEPAPVEDPDHEMTGMMTGDQMDRLAQLSGDAFDRMWLQMMIEHHQGAVAMSREVLGNGTNPPVSAMAQSIIDGQRAQIDRMQAMLRG